MKKILLITSILFAFAIHSFAQYTETFDVPNKGILLGPCSGSDGTTCTSNDFSGVNWTIDSEGLITKSGYLHFEDVDEESCWVGPLLNISSVPSSSVNVTFTIPAGTSWENSSTPGSTDYMDVEYSVDGGSYVAVANVNGCPGSGHTLSGVGCGGITGPFTTNVVETGIIGSNLQIRVCVDTNAASDDGWLETVSVPEVGAVVPVTWSSIAIEETERGSKLLWSTSSESDSDLFEIQRMNSLTEKFETIGQVEAAGYSTHELNYEFVDDIEFSNEKLYYRIKQVDFNGEYSYSEIVSLRISDLVNSEISIFPNPAHHSIQINGSDTFKEKISVVKIYNTLGALETQFDLSNLHKTTSIDISMLSSGIYFIQFADKNQVPLGDIIRIYKIGIN